MKKIVKRILAIGLFLFIAIQFYQPARNLDNGQFYATDFTQVYPMSPEIKAMFQISCYDCHSNNTNYLWYDYVQPARWLVEKHIRQAKKELNFNHWGTYSARKQERLLQSISEQVQTGQMPLRSYTVLHQNATLNQKQVQTLVAWLKQQQ